MNDPRRTVHSASTATPHPAWPAILALTALALAAPTPAAGDANTPVTTPAPDANAAPDAHQPADHGVREANSPTRPGRWSWDPNRWGGSTRGASTSDVWGRILLSILLILVLGAAAWYAVKRFGPKVAAGRGGRMSVQETVYLGPKKALHLVRIGSQEFLLGSSSERVSLLSEVKPPQEFRLPDDVRDVAETVVEAPAQEGS
jgi:flagellar biosynthetic protein FliO